MTNAPIPVEQFGTWLGELISTLQEADGQTADLDSSPPNSSGPGRSESRPSPFAPGVANFMHTIGHGFPRSANDFVGPTRTSAHTNDHVPTSHEARGAALLRRQIIQNLGFASARK